MVVPLVFLIGINSVNSLHCFLLKPIVWYFLYYTRHCFLIIDWIDFRYSVHSACGWDQPVGFLCLVETDILVFTICCLPWILPKLTVCYLYWYLSSRFVETNLLGFLLNSLLCCVLCGLTVWLSLLIFVPVIYIFCRDWPFCYHHW